MPALKIPDDGLLVEGPASNNNSSSLPLQAFAITLSDNVIEDMIKCVQNGGDIQLSLGNSPVSRFRIVIVIWMSIPPGTIAPGND
jgi:RNA polymerase II elongation factor ELL